MPSIPVWPDTRLVIMTHSERLRSAALKRWYRFRRALRALRRAARKLASFRRLSGEQRKFLPKQPVAALQSGKRVQDIQHRRRDLVIFFSDIDGFTHRSEHMETSEIAEFLNTYLTAMTAIAHDHGGVVNKFMGDGVMITFGDDAKSVAEENAMRCAEMALAMQDWIATVGRELGEPWLQVRMGMAAGICATGTFGSTDRVEYTAIGRYVNLAARLEEAAEPGQILMTPRLFEALRDEFEIVPCHRLPLKGLSGLTQSYALKQATGERSGRLAKIESELSGLD